MRLFLFSVFLFLSACGVTPAAFKKAETICKPNGGVGIYWVGLSGDTVKCENGLSVEVYQYKADEAKP